MKIHLPRCAPFADPIELPGSAGFASLMRSLAKGMRRGLDYVIIHRRAKVAEDLYLRLSRMSDAELARHGLSRRTIMEHVRKTLCA